MEQRGSKARVIRLQAPKLAAARVHLKMLTVPWRATCSITIMIDSTKSCSWPSKTTTCLILDHMDRLCITSQEASCPRSKWTFSRLRVMSYNSHKAPLRGMNCSARGAQVRAKLKQDALRIEMAARPSGPSPRARS